MSESRRSAGERGEDPSVSLRRVDRDGWREAVGLLFTGRPDPVGRTVNDFLGFMVGQGLSLENLWAAYRGDVPVAAALIVLGAGRTAMIFVSPILDRVNVPVMGRLIALACQEQDRERVRIVQALLDPGQGGEVQALTAGGFVQVACLRYMQRGLDAAGMSGPVEPPGEVVTWSEGRRALFAQAILGSYEQTLDCPGLLGLREIDDIIASHMAAGAFTPDLWFVFKIDNQPASVMLINRVPGRDAVELVYLGIGPAWRRRGLGRKLMALGLARARETGASGMILAVDEANAPAIGLYESLGFVTQTQKLAMISALA